MKRYIKFRQAITWENGTFEWHYWGYLHTDTTGLPVFVSPLGPVEWDKRESYQYTGIEDSKRTEEYPRGQKIYEDDLYKARDDIVYRVQRKVDGWGLFSGGKKGCVPDLHWINVCDATKGEVIGNFQQAPELLEQSTC